MTRLRDLGIAIGSYETGQHNAITDVAGVRVGHTTLIADEPTIARTGVTVIVPRDGDIWRDNCFAGFHSFNGCGEMTGIHWVRESGLLCSPIAITCTHSVGAAHEALVKYGEQRATSFIGALPVVAETWDGWLNDAGAHHLTHAHVFAALDGAKGGPVDEGCVGGGTGMICHGFKGGIGTSSRVLTVDGATYTVGVLVQANFGRRPQLTIAGVPVGKEIPLAPQQAAMLQDDATRGDLGSIIIVVATDAPLLPHQLKRLARRATLGMARTGGLSGNGSGDIFLAFSTANPGAFRPSGLAAVQMVSNEQISAIFDGTAWATEEAIVNAMVAAETMTGANGRRVERLPHDLLRAALKKYNRVAP